MTRTIRSKIIFSYTLPLLFSLLLMMGVCVGLIRQSVNAAQYEKLSILAADHAHQIEAKLHDRMAVMQRVDTLDYQHNFRDLALARHLAKFNKVFPVLSYLDKQGRENVKVLRGKMSIQLADRGDEAWFDEALQRRNEIVFSGIAASPDIGELCLSIGVARYGYFGDEFQGVLRGEIPLADLTSELPTLVPGRSGFAVLIDQLGRVLFHPEPESMSRSLRGDVASQGHEKATDSAGWNVTEAEIDGQRVLVGRSVIQPLGWTLLAVLPYDEFIAPSIRLGAFAAGTTLVSLLLGLLFAYRISKPLTRNLGRVVDQTRLIALGVLDRPLKIGSDDEVETLAEALNQMSRQIARAMEARDGLQGIQRSIIDPLVICDRDFCIRDVNEAAQYLLYRDKPAPIGEPISEFLGETDSDGESLLAMTRKYGELRNYDTRLRSVDGQRIPVLLSCSVPSARGPAEVGLVAVFKDISALKRAEAGRHKALTFTETLLDRSPMGIRVFDGLSGGCIRVNRAAAEVSGGQVEAMLEQNFRELESWRTAGLAEVAEAVLADGETRQVEATIATSFGKSLTGRYYFSRFEVDKHPNLLVIVQDISAEKLLSAEKRQIEEQMLHVQKLESLGVLAGGIAHDFNNILMTVTGNADLALMRLAPESPLSGYLQQILLAAGKAADLAGQMLAYSGRGKFIVESLDLNQVINELLHMLEVSLSKKANLHLKLSQSLPPVEADVTQLRQVIMNLVLNASEALGETSGMITVSTGVLDCDDDYLRETWLNEGLDTGIYVYLDVTDTGCGMPPETIDRIFDPFFSTKFAGRGLGMAAVLGIVRGHKGAIRVYSEINKGSTFKVLLPASGTPEERVDKDSAGPAWWGDGQVLLVDDEATILEVGETMLRELGYDVLTAADGREAVELFREHRQGIRLVLMDLTMPHMGGEEALREMRLLDPEVRVIISSGYTEDEIAHRFLGKGLTGNLQKPFRLSALRDALRKAGPRTP